MSVAEIFESMEYGPAPESAAPAEEWLERHDRRFGPFIAGELRSEASGGDFETHAPGSGKVLGRIAQCGPREVDEAVAAARAAQSDWWKIGGYGRARHLYAIARKIQKHSRRLAVLESLDNGKPIRESRDLDVPLAARHFYHHAGWAQVIDQRHPNWRPLGVAGQIIPWNFPLLMLAWKIAPALATGNTIVLKPAEFTSLSAIAFAELCRDAGLPPGVVNLVTGDGAVGEMIVAHPDIDKIAFTGSTEVGRVLRRDTAGTGKKLSLELGGKSPFVVFDDADLDGAVEGVVDAIWFNQGEVCCAGSRLLVQEGVAERFHDKLRTRMETLRLGDPLDKAIDIGAVVAPVQLERIKALVDRGVEEGATLWQPAATCPTDGWFFPPTLLTGVEPADTVAQEEIFGPVLVSMTFRTPDEAVALANNTRYGLAGSVWTENINLALQVAARIKAGTLWINCTNQFDAAAGFGGYRESGYGREGGEEGLWEYIRPAWELATEQKPQKVAKKPSKKAKGKPAAVAIGIDRTAKMYIGGKQARPDGGYSRSVVGPDGSPVGEIGEGNRKDIRNAVAAARKAGPGWAKASAHLRAQILFYVAENLEPRKAELAGRIVAMTGATAKASSQEVERAIERWFLWAGWADKYAGTVQAVPIRNFTFAVHEPLGTLGIVCPDENPLLAFTSTVAPALAMGNTVVAVPSEAHPLAATDLYQVFETSDVPAGVVNIVTGERSVLAPEMAKHDDLDGLWYFGPKAEAEPLESASIGNLKRTWVGHPGRDWTNSEQGAGEEFLRHAIQVKNIWVPWGE
ncbi:MAG: aldehyde dehydrogenase family protein [Acidobacteriota bacterium]